MKVLTKHILTRICLLLMTIVSLQEMFEVQTLCKFYNMFIFLQIINVTVNRFSQYMENRTLGWLLWIMMFMFSVVLSLMIVQLLGENNLQVLVLYCIFVYVFPSLWNSKQRQRIDSLSTLHTNMIEIFTVDEVFYWFGYINTIIKVVLLIDAYYIYISDTIFPFGVLFVVVLLWLFIEENLSYCLIVDENSNRRLAELSGITDNQHTSYDFIFVCFLHVKQKVCAPLPVICLFYIFGIYWKYTYLDDHLDNVIRDSAEMEKKSHHLTRIIMLTVFDYKTFYNIMKDQTILLVKLWLLDYHLVYEKFYGFYRFVCYILIVTINTVVFLFVIFTLGEYLYHSIGSKIHNTEFHYNYNAYDTTSREMYNNIQQRSVGEDVVFISSYQYPLDYADAAIYISWFHNDTFINETEGRIKQIEHFKQNDMVLSIFKIPVIEWSDYGIYTCKFVLRKAMNNKVIIKPLHGTFEERRSTYNYHVQNFRLILYMNKERAFHIPHGCGLTYLAFYYITIAEESDLAVKYTVNGEDIQDVCKWKIMSCNILAFLAFNIDEKEAPLKVKLTEFVFSQNIIQLEIRICMCSQMYGIHEVTIYRELFNHTTNKSEIKEIFFPKKVYFFPTENDSSINEDLLSSGLRYDILSLILEGKDTLELPSMLGYNIRLNIFEILNYILTSVIFVIIYGILNISNVIVKTYCRSTVVPFRNRLLFGTWNASIPNIQSPVFAGIQAPNDVIYDVFISYCDQDYDYVLAVILHFIESECKLRACFTDRDLSHEAGVSKLQLYTKATQQSHKFLVILTTDYLKDPDCNDLQLQRCILPLLCESTVPKKDLIVLRYRSIPIPVQIKWDPGVSIIDISDTNDFNCVKSTLKRKLYSY